MESLAQSVDAGNLFSREWHFASQPNARPYLRVVADGILSAVSFVPA